ncbi:hypothetical protein NE237_014508 [Protea cynaroides]|uniref:Cupin type-1 domain-containing protein n=1 Tax=Protea cynaroides TaxID=273540 RepID=A0A9Q0KC86_9MAGN|nr:hypothetical protein NE237_014508 [Protea cynaroides]
MGLLFPGCPETYHSFQQSRRFRGGESRRSRSDQHQKIQHYREGDIIAIPAGVAHWCYNNGDIPLVTVSVYDTGNTNANQLDQNLRRFQIAGNQQRQSRWSYDQSRRGQQRQREANSLFNGFDVEILADVFGVSTETARRLQNRDDLSGHIIRVESGLRHVARPPRREREEDQPWSWRPDNGLEESICTMRIRENIGDPERADIYSPEAGRLTTLNSLKLPILNQLQLSAQRGVLYRNSIHAPQWHTNAHSIIYVTRGNARVQIVGNYARPVFNGELREGQLLVIPQNFAVVKESGDEGFEWISFKTNGNPITSHLAGKTSVLRGMPADVLANAFGISRDEANRLKYNREEVQLFRSRLSRSRQWTTASA